MPKKIETENQFLRLLSNSPLQLDIQFCVSMRVNPVIRRRNT
jgi:homoserine O-succinyltransferase